MGGIKGGRTIIRFYFIVFVESLALYILFCVFYLRNLMCHPSNFSPRFYSLHFFLLYLFLCTQDSTNTIESSQLQTSCKGSKQRYLLSSLIATKFLGILNTKIDTIFLTASNSLQIQNTMCSVVDVFSNKVYFSGNQKRQTNKQTNK